MTKGRIVLIQKDSSKSTLHAYMERADRNNSTETLSKFGKKWISDQRAKQM